MNINSSSQQIAGGGAAVSGMILQQKTEFSPLGQHNTVGNEMVWISL
jgi:hypothetical protein